MSESQPPPADPGTSDGTATTSRRDPLRGSRTSGLWVSVVLSGIVLVLLIVFIAQNTDPVRVSFLGWEGETPLAVALLIATVAGLFLATVAGTLRILQLRRRVRRETR
jgi:uncharacterized integral membrane protein